MADVTIMIVLFLLEKAVSSLNQEANLHQRAEDEVVEVTNNLMMLKAYLKDMEGNEGSEVLKDKVIQVQQVAYDIEDALEEFMLHVTHRFHRHKISRRAHELVHAVTLRIPLHSMSSKVKVIKSKIESITKFDSFCDSRTSNSTIVEKGLQESPRALDDDEMVGFENPKERLIHQLITKGESRDTTISVVGPCGSGKTILVKNVYECKKVKGWFDCHAWVHVSRSCKIEELLGNMLKQFCISRKEQIPHDHEAADTKAKLRYYLQEKRYVVVLDDIWSREDWECIQNVLPINSSSSSSSSRIIVTTRNADVAKFCVESSHFIHHLTHLPGPVAWDLFCKKAFPTNNGKCPPKLEDWSQKIVKRCQGWPLAIVAVSSLLSRRKQFPIEWKKMHDSLVSEIGTNSANLSIIRKLLPSYKDLSSNLRTCFLYFSIFPENYSIKRGRLIRLWVAEGFVMKARNKTMEDVAEDYLNELIGRNLVQVNSKDVDGRVMSCWVLNLVHEFIILKSEEVNFASIFTEATTSSRHEKIRRLSIHNSCTALSLSQPSFNCVRSAFLFRRDKFSPSEIGNVLSDFKLLRVLDLQDAAFDKFPQDIFRLTLLRYLSLRNANIKTVPKSIKKLSYLETLDLRETQVTGLPKKIIQLHNLRHLLIYRRECDVKNYATSSDHSVQGVELSVGTGALTNLQKLSLIKLDKHHKIIKQLAALTQLRKLGLTELKAEDGKDLCTAIQSMQNVWTLDLSSTSNDKGYLDLNHMCCPPPHLRRLYLKGRLWEFPAWITSLNNLLKIGLKGSKLKSSPLVPLQDLPNLMELQLFDAFTGGELLFETGKFKKLKILQIEQFDQLQTVVVHEGALSKLKKLTLQNCVNLKSLPLGINYLTHLDVCHRVKFHAQIFAPVRRQDSCLDQPTTQPRKENRILRIGFHHRRDCTIQFQPRNQTHTQNKAFTGNSSQHFIHYISYEYKGHWPKATKIDSPLQIRPHHCV